MSFFVAAFLQVVLAVVANAPVPEIPAAVRRAAEQRVTDGYYPSIVIGIVDERGSTLLAHGTTRRQGATEVDGDTLYEIGSVTKGFTGVLLALAVERGEVGLEDAIEGLLPRGTAAPRHDGRSITLLDLATQSSGLPRLPTNMAPKDPGNPYADYTVEQLHEFLRAHELRRPIGSRYEYSNLGFGLLGQLLARRAKTDYEELVKSRISRVLGMDDTTITVSEQLGERWAQGYRGALEAGNWDLPTFAGAGALRSTAHDMLTFVAANLGLRESPLLAAMRMSHAIRRDAGSSTMGIGLGWHVRRGDDRELVWHNGGTGGYRTFCGFVPAERRGVVVLTNGTLSADDLGFHLLDPALELSEAFPPTPSIERPTLLAYAGRYQLEQGPVLDLEVVNGFLTVQVSGQQRFTLYPSSVSEFRLLAPAATCAFRRDDAGTVVSLVWSQGGITSTGRKLAPGR